MKGMILMMLVCVSGCMTLRAERFKGTKVVAVEAPATPETERKIVETPPVAVNQAQTVAVAEKEKPKIEVPAAPPAFVVGTSSKRL